MEEAYRENTIPHVRNCRLYPIVLASRTMTPNAFNMENTPFLINDLKDLKIDERI
jgi:hypothetical protein